MQTEPAGPVVVGGVGFRLSCLRISGAIVVHPRKPAVRSSSREGIATRHRQLQSVHTPCRKGPSLLFRGHRRGITAVRIDRVEVVAVQLFGEGDLLAVRRPHGPALAGARPAHRGLTGSVGIRCPHGVGCVGIIVRAHEHKLAVDTGVGRLCGRRCNCHQDSARSCRQHADDSTAHQTPLDGGRSQTRALRALHRRRARDHAASSLPASFFRRSVHDVARDLIGCTVAHGADRRRDRRDRELPRRRSGMPRLRRADAAQQRAVRAARPRLRVLLLRHPQPAQLRGRAGGRGGGGPDPRAGADGGHRRDAPAPRGGARAGPLLGPGQADAGARHWARAERHPAGGRADPCVAAHRWLERPGDRHRPAHRHHEGGRAPVAVLRGGQPLRLPAVAAG